VIILIPFQSLFFLFFSIRVNISQKEVYSPSLIRRPLLSQFFFFTPFLFPPPTGELFLLPFRDRSVHFLPFPPAPFRPLLSTTSVLFSLATFEHLLSSSHAFYGVPSPHLEKFRFEFPHSANPLSTESIFFFLFPRPLSKISPFSFFTEAAPSSSVSELSFLPFGLLFFPCST